ncbi:hypothetical protein RQP46_002654 [Phenoliferia psychrophenolica]
MMDYDHESPVSSPGSHGFEDPDSHDSSSSSSGDHSSPSDDLFPSPPSAVGGLTSAQGWPYDFSALPPSQHQQYDWDGTGKGAFGHPHLGHLGQEPLLMNGLGDDDPHGALALTGDFWSTAPSTTVHSPETRSHRDDDDDTDVKPDLDLGADDAAARMEVEFDDVVHHNSCGPASSTYADHPTAAFLPSSIAPASSTVPNSEHLFLSALSSLSMPLDLHAVNAGIAPQLMGGARSPPLPLLDSHQIDPLLSQPQSQSHSRESSRERDSSASGSGSRETSSSRSAPPPPPPLAAATTAAPIAPAPAPAPTNLVAKDAVVAASFIPTLSSPANTAPLAQDHGYKLLVLGVPTVGAKSRVETQIKISLVLVAPKVKNEAVQAGGDLSHLVTSDGGLVENAGEGLMRVGSWSHVRLPKYLALKKKNKKQAKQDPAADDTLFLDVAVIRGSEPFEEIFICTGCQQRELKRAQRKKDSRVRPPGEAEGVATYGIEEDEERRKVVVFNCAEYVDFAAGETVLPTRITCYCRHHKERKGFSVGFTLRTASGVLVASGATPPIMITDDHKTSIRPVASTSADVSVEAIEPPKPSKRAKAPKQQQQQQDKVASDATSALSQSTSSRPKRSAGRQKAARGSIVESDDDQPPAPAPRAPNGGGGAKKAAKPYDSDARPRKRAQAGQHRSPSFAMTPLVVSKPGSPVMRPVPLQDTSPALIPSPIPSSIFDAATQAQAPHEWESALGLGGMDAVMQDSVGGSSGAYSVHSNDGTNGGYSTAPSPANGGYSTAPSPAQSNGWRSDVSSPPANDAFAQMFAGLNNAASPLDMTSPRRSGLASPVPLPTHSAAADSFASLYDPAANPAFASWPYPAVAPPRPAPRISRLIPGEGPVHGGIEVTVLGENFVPDLVCVFGDAAAVPTHFWSSNTLVCILPPSANPGPVVVGIKGVPLTVEQGTGLQLFTYKDDSDRSLLELALQVVGLKMTGRLEDASAVAMRIVGNSAHPSSNNTPAGTRNSSPVDGNVLAGMAAMSSQSHSYSNSSRPASRAPSRSASQVNLASTPPSSTIPLPSPVLGETRSFEGIVIKFLSLLDLPASSIPGAAPSLPRARPPISHLNAQQHSLLHLAAVLGFHRLVQFLLARGIATDSPDRNGFTPLHFAALYGRVAITRLLLDAGAHAYPRNLAGKTPLDIARDRDDIDVEEVFLRSAPPRRPTNPTRSSSYSTRPVSRAPEPQHEDLRGSYSDETSDSDSDSESDESGFLSSEYDDESSDVERRLSRNASMVSLHYLLEAEADADAALSLPSPPPSDSEGPPSRSPKPETTMPELANAAGTWLSRSLAKPQQPIQLPPSVTTAWEKMQHNAVWEKMNGRFQIPESLTTLPAFAPWRTAKDVSGGEESDGGTKEKKGAPWWPRQSAILSPLTSPPPMYTPNDAYSPTDSKQGDTSASSSTLDPSSTHLYPPPSRTSTPPTKAAVQAKLQRRVGYVPEEISDSLVQSFVTHEKTLHRLRDDRMLAFFWIPVLIVVAFWTLYTSFGSIQPFLLAVADTVIPFARVR